MRSRSIDFIINNTKTQFTHKTISLKFKIEKIMITRSLYLLLISQFDVIIEMPFFRQNEIDFTELKFENIEINENKMLINKNDIDMNVNTKSPENIKIIKIIFRKRLKKELKHDEIEEFYLIII